MFPAYRNDEAWRKPTTSHSENASQGDSASRSYSSFKSVQSLRNEEEKRKKKRDFEEMERIRKKREKLKKEERNRRALSKYSIKVVSLDSDDDSDGLDISVEGIRKLENRYKEKERKKASSSESEDDEITPPSISQILAQDLQWSFLRPDWNPNIPSSFLISDYKAVRGNLFYDSLPKKELSDYHLSLNRLIGGSDELSRVIYPPKEKSKRQKRYFAEKVFKAWSNNPVKYNITKAPPPISGYLELDGNQQNTTSIEMEWESYRPATDLISETEGGPEIRSKLYNKRLKDEETNIDLWLRFVAVQDECYMERSESQGNKKEKKSYLTDKALLDRKLVILDKAIQKNPLSVKLKIERLKIGRHFWEAEKFEHEVKTVEFYHVNDPEMWTGLFDLLENDSRRFSYEKMLKLLKRGIEQLSAVLRGDIVTHPALPGTEAYLTSVMIRMIRLMLNCGYSERAVGCAQAFCEFNICYPTSCESLSSKEKREAFRIFWESGIARIGDVGSEDKWAKSISLLNSSHVLTDRSELDEEDSLREKLEYDYANGVGVNGKKHSISEVWRYVEALRLCSLWRPIRDRNIEVDDRDRYVSMQHVQAMLVPIKREFAVKFLLDVLNLFGATIYKRVLF